MRVVNQRSDIDMGNMPTQLISGSHQIAVGGISAVRAAKDAAGSFAARPAVARSRLQGPKGLKAPMGRANDRAVLMAVWAGRTCTALTGPDDFEMTLGLVLNLASLLAILPHPIALALRLAAWGLSDALRLA